LALAGTAAFANEAFEARIAELERLGIEAHWRESARRIDALEPHLDALSPEQRVRVEFVRLRSLGLAGREEEALDGFTALLQREMPAALRLRTLTTAITVAANTGDWPLAFDWLNQGLEYVPQAPEAAPGLLGVASYLHTLVGEIDKARELGRQGLAAVQAGG